MDILGSFLEISKLYLSCISVHAEGATASETLRQKDRVDYSQSGEK